MRPLGGTNACFCAVRVAAQGCYDRGRRRAKVYYFFVQCKKMYFGRLSSLLSLVLFPETLAQQLFHILLGSVDERTRKSCRHPTPADPQPRLAYLLVCIASGTSVSHKSQGVVRCMFCLPHSNRIPDMNRAFVPGGEGGRAGGSESRPLKG